MSSDWRDGFLFIGNQLALDLLNTKPLIDGAPHDLLRNPGDFARWLTAAGLVSKPYAKRLQQQWSALTDQDLLEPFRQFREKLRKAVSQVEAGAAPSAVFIHELNALLREHPRREQIVTAPGGLERQEYFHPQTPGDAFAPLAHAAADLLTGADSSRLRKCQRCVLHFYDTSKKGTRVWCSMNLCGNRAKVAAYARRKRSPLTFK